MSALARWLARRLWWGMLWLMRRPRMKAFQRASTRWLPAAAQARAARSLQRQNALARRHGLPMLTTSIVLLLASLAITTGYQAALWLADSGVLSPPAHLQDDYRDAAGGGP